MKIKKKSLHSTADTGAKFSPKSFLHFFFNFVVAKKKTKKKTYCYRCFEIDVRHNYFSMKFKKVSSEMKNLFSFLTL